MGHDLPTADDRVNVFIEQLDLPYDEQRRETILDDLEHAVKTVIDDHGLNVDRIKTVDGHTFTSVRDYCPECGHQLKLVEPRLDSDNGASAMATCECGWHGKAIYRIIDLVEPIPPVSHTQATLEEAANGDEPSMSIFDEASSVRTNSVKPTYLPY